MCTVVQTVSHRRGTGAGSLRLRALDWLAASRPAHWAKNALVLVPVVASHRFNVEAWFAAGATAVAFCLCASGVYLLNDVTDRAADRLSPTKARRPIAAGRIGAPAALAGAFALVALGFALSVVVAAWVGGYVAAWVGGYVAAAVVYSVWVKRWALLDVAWLAGMYELRIAAGAAAAGLSGISVWLFGLSLFAFLALALAKRLGEIRAAQAQGIPMVPGRDWRVVDAPLALALATACAAVAALAAILYADSQTAHRLYTHPELLWLACPGVALGLARLLLAGNRGDMGEDPVAFVLTDPVSWVIFAILAGAVGAAL